jgi:surface antigen
METRLQVFLERSVVGVTRRTAVLLAVLTTTMLGLGVLGVGSAVARPAAMAPPAPARTLVSTSPATTAATPTTGATTTPTVATSTVATTTAATVTTTTPAPPPVTTEGVLLCSGYTACSTDGFTTNGYAANEKTSWWRMYPGDNCTNYVAYVESQVFGVTEPTYLLGDADQWAANAGANGVPVDNTPTVGSVAFWGAGTVGMKRYGHVAIVEAVGPNDSYIDVSQSGMGKSDDGYDWERIYAGSTVWEPWPNSFIHFPGANIPQPQAQAAAVQAPVTWPQVMLSQLTWGTQSNGADTLLQLPTLG